MDSESTAVSPSTVTPDAALLECILSYILLSDPDVECDEPCDFECLFKKKLLVDATKPLFIIFWGSWNNLRIV